MNWTDSLSNNDNVISEMIIKENEIILDILTWDNKHQFLKFSNYYAFKGNNLIGVDIGDILIQSNSPLMQSIISSKSIVSPKDEFKGLQCYIFYSAWGYLILEIIAENVTVE